MSPEAVAQYLQHNPKFFDEYADLMAQIFVPHPHGGRAVSLSERQMLTLREKVRALEHTLADLVETGHSNDALSNKMHRLTLALLRAAPIAPTRVLDRLTYHLQEDFAIPHAGFRAWGVKPEFDGNGEVPTLVGPLLDLAASGPAMFKLPYSGPIHGYLVDDVPVGDAVAAWFGDAAPHLKSLALMRVSGGAGSGGLLALASEDERRFYAGMGTVYLERLAESLSAALAHLFPVP